MGPEGAANILYGKQIQEADNPEAERERLTEEYKATYLTPYAAAEAGYVDDILEPSKTRQNIIAALNACREKQVSVPTRKHGNSPV
jgi:propionyl-CoA carboxylase beta chain